MGPAASASRPPSVGVPLGGAAAAPVGIDVSTPTGLSVVVLLVVLVLVLLCCSGYVYWRVYLLPDEEDRRKAEAEGRRKAAEAGQQEEQEEEEGGRGKGGSSGKQYDNPLHFKRSSKQLQNFTGTGTSSSEIAGSLRASGSMRSFRGGQQFTVSNPVYVPVADEPSVPPSNWPVTSQVEPRPGVLSPQRGISSIKLPAQQQQSLAIPRRVEDTGDESPPSPTFPPPTHLVSARFLPTAAASAAVVEATPPQPQPSAEHLMSQLTSALAVASAVASKSRQLLHSARAEAGAEQVPAAAAAAAVAAPAPSAATSAASTAAPSAASTSASTSASTATPSAASPPVSATATSPPPSMLPVALPSLAAVAQPLSGSRRSGADSRARGSSRRKSVTFSRMPAPLLTAAPAREQAALAQAREEAALAQAWVRRWSQSKGAYYYFNLGTQAAVWVLPAAAGVAVYEESGEDGALVPLAAAAQPEEVGQRFVKKWSASKGCPYYVDLVSKAPTWELPAGGAVVQDDTGLGR